MSGIRIPARGERIDRSKTLQFQFNGRSFQGFAGDTLASALLAAGESLLQICQDKGMPNRSTVIARILRASSGSSTSISNGWSPVDRMPVFSALGCGSVIASGGFASF